MNHNFKFNCFLILSLLILSFLSFCGGSVKNLDQQISILREDITEIKKSNSILFKKFIDMDSRLSLLEDEIDTLKMARKSKPSPKINSVQTFFQIQHDLPVVKIQPEEEQGVVKIESDLTDEADINNEQNQALSPKEIHFQEIDENGNIIDRNSEIKSNAKDNLAIKKSKNNFHLNESRNTLKKEITHTESAKNNNNQTITILDEYNKAYSLYKQHEYISAYNAFINFAKNYPKHSYADNSIYWAGECMYDMKEYEKALAQFKQVLTLYPDGNKVPDAMLKIGILYSAIGKEQESQKQLNELILMFPTSEASIIAYKILNERSNGGYK